MKTEREFRVVSERQGEKAGRGGARRETRLTLKETRRGWRSIAVDLHSRGRELALDGQGNRLIQRKSAGQGSEKDDAPRGRRRGAHAYMVLAKVPSGTAVRYHYLHHVLRLA